MPTTNDELATRLDILEAKVDRLTALMEQASGAWFFIKIISSLLIGLTVLYNAFNGLFK